MTLPTPVRFANYKGNQTQAVGQHMGPNMLGEHFTVTKAWYDPETDMTKLGLAIGIHKAD